jgi:predicted glycogen debranching enzyme
MSYLKFDKTQLVNLEYIWNREILRSNKKGAYASSTIIGMNTRKYHGLLICPIEAFGNERHVLLSSVDETLIQHEQEFHLGVRKYQGGAISPKGHKYIHDFEIEPFPKITYRVGGVVLTKQLMLSSQDNLILLKYTLEDAKSPTTLRLLPFLAFREIHKLAQSNLNINTKYQAIPNGIRYKMYNAYPNMYMQLSKRNDFVPVPHWYYRVEYMKEQLRGYDCHEDLYVPGYFEFPLEKGESVMFAAGMTEMEPSNLLQYFDDEIKARIPRDSFENCLINSAQQFFVKDAKKTEIIAGFPWFGRWGRDTFISLPGLTLALGDPKTCKDVLDTMSRELNGPLFPNIGSADAAAYNSVDAPLWYFWAIQKYLEYTQDYEGVWKAYGEKMKNILHGYRNGETPYIRMHDNGLIYSGTNGKALTWMDAVIDGRAVTPRIGYDVEINALWYNAIRFTLELARKFHDEIFVEQWMPIHPVLKDSFVALFWDDRKGYLADYMDGGYKDWSIRPNQIFATSLPYSMLSPEQSRSVLELVKHKLLTPKGLRTLSPDHPSYKGRYEGTQTERDLAYHQGTVWPWLLGHFAEGYLKVHQKSAYSFIHKLIYKFEEEMDAHGIGSISEVFEADPPHQASGTISQAWSVAEILRTMKLLEQYKS